MVPAIRNILGGFLFAGDDVYKKAGVLSGGERTRLAVARMLLRPANLLLLDEPTNHLDLDSKDVLLESLEGFTGTLILVSHDRYFVDRLATKIIAVGHGEALVYPGTYEEFRWSQAAARPPRPTPSAGRPRRRRRRSQPAAAKQPGNRPAAARHANPATTDRRRGQHGVGDPGRAAHRPAPPRRPRTATSASGSRPSSAGCAAPGRPTRSASHASRAGSPSASARSRRSRTTMGKPGFYDDPVASKPVIDRHQALMWEVGDRMAEWEALLEAAPPTP